MKKLLATLALLIVGTAAYADSADSYLNRPVPHKYRFSDNTFLTVSAGANLAMSDYILKDKPYKSLRPQVDLYYGKNVLKWMALRAGVGFMSQRAGVPVSAQNLKPDYCEPYSFGIATLKLDAMICLDRIFTRYNPNERFQLWAVGGLGGARTFEFQDKVKDYYYHMTVDSKGHWYGTLHAGLEAQWNLSPHCSFLVSGLWHWMSKDYNGAYNFDGSSMQSGLCRNFASLNLGLVYRFTNQYGKTYFTDCAHNENYYFDVMNKRLDHVYGSSAQCERKDILLFPHKYAYITPQQKKKLHEMVRYLKKDYRTVAVIDVYSDGDEAPMDNQFRAQIRAERILAAAEAIQSGISERMEIILHDEASPYGSENIWSLAGVISYK